MKLAGSEWHRPSSNLPGHLAKIILGGWWKCSPLHHLASASSSAILRQGIQEWESPNERHLLKQLLFTLGVPSGSEPASDPGRGKGIVATWVDLKDPVRAKWSVPTSRIKATFRQPKVSLREGHYDAKPDRAGGDMANKPTGTLLLQGRTSGCDVFKPQTGVTR